MKCACCCVGQMSGDLTVQYRIASGLTRTRLLTIEFFLDYGWFDLSQSTKRAFFYLCLKQKKENYTVYSLVLGETTVIDF